MFGYIFPDKPELKIKEFEVFRAYYCGLCKAIGQDMGQVSRWALNYDSSFLGMFLSSFKDEGEIIERERCAAHPLSKRFVVQKTPILQYASDMNVILAYYKLRDDWKDNKSIKALGLSDMLYRGFKKAKSRSFDKAEVIKKRLDELSSIEKQNCMSIDMAAEPFARLTEELFAYEPLYVPGNNEEKLRWFGYNIGKWIYLIDAYNDIEDDVRKGNYNPLLAQFEYDGADISEFKKSIKENINFTLTYTLSEAGRAFETMEIKKNKSIIENIIYGGMYKKTIQIIG